MMFHPPHSENFTHLLTNAVFGTRIPFQLYHLQSDDPTQRIGPGTGPEGTHKPGSWQSKRAGDKEFYGS